MHSDDAKARVLYRGWVDLQGINSNRFPAWHELLIGTQNAWRRKAAAGEMPAPAGKPPRSGNSVAADSLPRTTDPHERLEFNLSAAQEQTPLLDKYFGVQETLQERGSRYGDFTDNARISQQLKSLMAGFSGWGELNYVQREALEMIAQKVARILNGDPNYRDNWHDIQGYARLAEERCNET